LYKRDSEKRGFEVSQEQDESNNNQSIKTEEFGRPASVHAGICG
jgi:hypothetical protein